MSLEVKNLKVYYKTLRGHVKALDDLSFSVQDGEILGIAGESGCGKSTLSNALIYLAPPMEQMGGTVRLDGKELPLSDSEGMRKFRYSEISIIPQYALNALNPTVKIGRYIRDLMECHGIEYSTIEKELLDRIEFVKLPANILKKFPIELSGGMKQRVVMVISTLLNPSLLLADEITSALDVSTQKTVSELVVAIRDRQFVKSVTFVTHDVPVLYQIADRIMIMYAGKLAEIGPAEDIVHRPRHPYTKALVAAMPDIGTTYRDSPYTSIPGRPPDLLDPPKGCRFKDRCPVRDSRCDTDPPEIEVEPGRIVACWKEDS